MKAKFRITFTWEESGIDWGSLQDEHGEFCRRQWKQVLPALIRYHKKLGGTGIPDDAKSTIKITPLKGY